MLWEWESESGLVKLPLIEENDSTLEETEESEKAEQAVDGLLILSPWLCDSSSIGDLERLICAAGVFGGGEHNLPIGGSEVMWLDSIAVSI